MKGESIFSHGKPSRCSIVNKPCDLPAIRRSQSHYKILLSLFSYLQSCVDLIHSGYLYSTSSSPHLRGASDAARIGLLYRSFTPKRHRQLRGKDLLKVPTWWLEQDPNLRPFGRKAPNLPMSQHFSCGGSKIYFVVLALTCCLTLIN